MARGRSGIKKMSLGGGAGIFDAMDVTGGKIIIHPKTVVIITVVLLVVAYLFNTVVSIL